MTNLADEIKKLEKDIKTKERLSGDTRILYALLSAYRQKAINRPTIKNKGY